MLIPFGVFSAAGAGGGAAAGSYELISTTLLSTSTASVSFSSIVGTYKHLQIRMTTRSAGSADVAQLAFNSDTSNNYTDHFLYGNGSSVLSGANTIPSFAGILVGQSLGSGETSNSFATSIVDILDYASSSKNTTVRSFYGGHTSSWNRIYLRSGMWNSTSAVTSISLVNNGGASFATGSRISLYGIKGA
jgi:hypothetical protein